MRIRRAPNIICLILCLISTKVLPQQMEVSFQVFYDNLSPYGHWVKYDGHGLVWIPDIGGSFVPYSTAGHWVYTDYGWTWLSDYSWGWAPFHYGRWNYDNELGWYWIPGGDWGPAWVSWRSTDDYYGWAPLQAEASLNSGYSEPFTWAFMKARYITDAKTSYHEESKTQNKKYLESSSFINRTYTDNNFKVIYVQGPKREDVEKATGNKISTLTVQQGDVPGQVISGNKLVIYRPAISRATASTPHPMPAKIETLKDVERRSKRSKEEGHQTK